MRNEGHFWLRLYGTYGFCYVKKVHLINVFYPEVGKNGYIHGLWLYRGL